jgi:FkbM family methyltransferase
VIRAWQKRWDAVHYVRLLRWRDAGFKPKVVYDIGAHEGDWAEMCSEVLSPRQVVLFEPQLQLHERIKIRQARVQSGEWKIFAFALGDVDASETMHLTQNSAAASLLEPVRGSRLSECGLGARATVQVPVRSLDNVITTEQVEPADLIKIDVQGLEDKVLDGGMRTISQAEKLVIEVSLREIYSGQALLFDILQRVASWGFVVEDITETLRRWPSGELWQVDLWLGRSARA